MGPQTVDIRPGVSVLAVLRHLNYRPWYALAEFVDNSVESFLTHRRSLGQTQPGRRTRLAVDIDIDSTPPASISIRDNAAGIQGTEYARAFRPASLPTNRTGLAEFGMGMKSAACWFAPRWTVRTSAHGEPVVRTVDFDIQNIVDDDIQELDILEAPEDAAHHYTEILLRDVFHVPVGRTVGKLKEHLTDIYRGFIRDDILDLRFNGTLLSYSEPAVLAAPYYKDKDGPSRVWRKEIDFDFGEGLSVRGFAALRNTGSTTRAGFSLFRRNRVVQGSGDEKYRPRYIFGSPNRYCFQRLFGELHLGGFAVSHTKDGFRWDDNEEPFLELLREHLDSEDLPMLRQAEGYRVREPVSRIADIAKKAVKKTATVMAEQLPTVLPSVVDAEPVETPTVRESVSPAIAGRNFDLSFRDTKWTIEVEITGDPAEGQWLSITDVPSRHSQPRCLSIRVSMAHPFMVRFAQNDPEDVEALLRVAAAIAVAEVLARDAGVRYAGTVRRNINDILRHALSQG